MKMKPKFTVALVPLMNESKLSEDPYNRTYVQSTLSSGLTVSSSYNTLTNVEFFFPIDMEVTKPYEN